MLKKFRAKLVFNAIEYIAGKCLFISIHMNWFIHVSGGNRGTKYHQIVNHYFCISLYHNFLRPALDPILVFLLITYALHISDDIRLAGPLPSVMIFCLIADK